ncbi:MAG: signal peptide peptidase SppA [Phycisphaerales bacterium]|nr:signal peptide peptidase SppA [Phycisphaerales bacterium]
MLKTMRQFVALLTMAGLLAVPASKVAGSDTVAVMKIKGMLSEQPDAMGLGPILGTEAPPNMFDLLKTLRAARKDPNLKAIIFDVDEAAMGFAQIQELRAQFEALRAVDKDVWVFTESLHQGSLMLSSAASRVVLVPSGEVDFRGMYAESLYFKKLLDNVGLEADILHCGDYKSAGEPFYLTGPSDEAKEQMNGLFDSLFDEMVEVIAKSRRLTPDHVRELVDNGVFDAEEAEKAKLVDKLMYREDFVKHIKKRYGRDTEIDFDYGKKVGPDIDFANPFDVLKIFGEIMKGPKKSDETAIAVVYVEGPITTGASEPSMFGGSSNAGSATIRKAIATAAEDDTVKALVLRVDSPGGSALASDVIAEATKRFKDSGRPVIVSMGNVAASGGYYVSTLADAIFAEPSTITGSIGVVGGKFVTKGFWDWAGVSSHEYKRGKLADMMNSNRKFSEKERKVVMDYMNRVYDDFKDRVLAGRKDKLTGEIESLAGGRVYSGKRALEIGLVDQLGGFTDAIKYAAAEAEISDYELRVYPQPKTFLEVLAEAFGGKGGEDEFVQLRAAVRQAIGPKFARTPSLAAALDAMRVVDPAKAEVLQNFLVHMELLADERVLLVGPSITTLIR